MYSRSASVPDAVKEVLASNNVYMQALRLGIANYTALAQKIKPEVEMIVGTRVNENTVVVAIKRFVDSLEEDDKPVEGEALRGARMSLTGNIIDVNFDREFDAVMSDMLDRIFEKESRYSLFQTDRHLRFFAEDVEEIRSIVAVVTKKFDGKISGGLSKISIKLQPNAENPYDLLSTVSTVLYNNGISLQDAFFTPREIVLILKDRDAARAYDLLRSKMVE